MPRVASAGKSSMKRAMLEKLSSPFQGGSSYRLPRLTLKKRLTALVVDGERTCQMYQQGLLVHYGVATQVVGNGGDAIDLFVAGSRFDLVVVDMFLPEMNGLEVTMQIRAMGVRCKIVGYTASGYENERRAFLEAGADEFYEKPLDPEPLVRILSEIDNQ